MASEEHSLQTYVSDMLALERHIRVPLEAQVKDDDIAGYGNALSIITRLDSLTQQHIDNLERCLDSLGGHPASPLKSAVASFEGFFAGAFDKIRRSKVSKALRDDYTALSLCTVSYTMLHTTATSLGDLNVASLAQNHLTDYAGCVMEIASAMPAVVLADLRESGLAVDSTVGESSRRVTQEAWRTSSDAVVRATKGTVDAGRIENAQL